MQCFDRPEYFQFRLIIGLMWTTFLLYYDARRIFDQFKFMLGLVIGYYVIIQCSILVV